MIHPIAADWRSDGFMAFSAAAWYAYKWTSAASSVTSAAASKHCHAAGSASSRSAAGFLQVWLDGMGVHLQFLQSRKPHCLFAVAVAWLVQLDREFVN